jgi:hypothetical protein
VVPERVVKTAKPTLSIAIRLFAKSKQQRLALLQQLRVFRGRLAYYFKFDREDAKSRC